MGIRRTHIVAGLSLVAALTALVVVTANWSAHQASAQSTPTLALDLDPTNGSGPCNPVDNVRAVNSGDEFEVAICLSNANTAPIDFQIDVKYNDDLNQCVPVDCSGTTCLDGNPDANVGSTTFGGTSLGTGWDCNIMQVQGPICDNDPGSGKGHGDAHIVCNSAAGELTLNAGEGVTAPLAMITFKSVASGTDTMTFDDAAVDDDNIQPIVDQVVSIGAVVGGSISTEGVPPTLTPEATGTVPPTPTTNPIDAAVTASAVETAVAQGTPAAAFTAAANATTAGSATSGAKTTPAANATSKATAKPATANGEDNGDDSSGPSTAVIAIIAVAAVVVVGGAGFFGYRRFFGR